MNFTWINLFPCFLCNNWHIVNVSLTFARPRATPDDYDAQLIQINNNVDEERQSDSREVLCFPFVLLLSLIN
jgi:hypothetical protein